MSNYEQNFARNQLMFGKSSLEIFKNARVTICGLGAVGSYTVESLARMGIGNLTIIDFDTVKRSNINRQLFALESTLGQKKTEIAKTRILDINPECNVNALEIFIHNETFEKILESKPDIVVDAIDSFTPKLALLENLYNHKIPVISSMGAARKLDPSKIKVGDISKTEYCKLAYFIRTALKSKKIYRGIKCIYSTEIPIEADTSEISEAQIETRDYIRGRERKPMPSTSYITGMFGLYITSEIVNFILEKHDKK